MTDRIRRIFIIFLLILLVLALLTGGVQTFRLNAASAQLDAEKLRADGLENQLRQTRTSVAALGQFGTATQGNCADTFEKFIAIPGLAALPVSAPEGQDSIPGTIAEPAGDGAAMRTSLSRKGVAAGAAPASTPHDAAFTEFLNAF